MNVADALSERKYAGLAVASAFSMFVFVPYVQTLGYPEMWFSKQDILTFAIFVLFDAVFGVFVAFHAKRLFGSKACRINRKGAGSGVVGSAMGIFIGACPACFGLLGLLFPIGIVSAIGALGPLFALLGIALMLFSIKTSSS